MNPRTWIVVIIVSAFLGGFLVWEFETHNADAKVAKAEQDAATWRAALAARIAQEATQDSVEGKMRASRDSALTRAARDSAAAAEAHGRVVVITRPAPVDSSNPAWERIAVAEGEQVDALSAEVVERKRAAAHADSMLALMTVSRDGWRAQATSADTVITGLRRAVEVERLVGGCHLLGYIPCPSRTVAYVAGAASAVALGVYVHKRAPNF